MTTNTILGIMGLRLLQITDVAKDVGEGDFFVRNVLYYRVLETDKPKLGRMGATRRVRLKLALYLGIPVEKLFDDAPPASEQELKVISDSLKHLNLVCHQVHQALAKAA